MESKARRTALVVLGVLVLIFGAVFAARAESGCITSGVTTSPSGSPLLTGWDGTDPEGTVRGDIVGTFLWAQINGGEITSVELPATAERVTICADGTVQIVEAAPVIDDGVSSPPVTVAPPGTASTVVVVYELPSVWQRPFRGGTVAA